MKRPLQRIIALALAFSLIHSVCLPTQAVTASSSASSTFEIQNHNARRLYNSLVSASQINRLSVQPDTTSSSKATFSEQDNTFSGDFEILNLAIAQESDKEIIYSNSTETIHTVIEHNTYTNTYCLMEAQVGTDEVLFVVDGEPFLLVMEGDNIIMRSEAGSILPVITSVEGCPPEKSNLSYHNMLTEKEPRLTTILNDSYEQQGGTGHNWSSPSGPHYRTTQNWCQILAIVSGTAGEIVCSVKHPVLGKILLALAGALEIGALYYVELYIKYYDYYDLNDMYWTKMVEFWYENSDYTGFIEQREIINYDDTPW